MQTELCLPVFVPAGPSTWNTLPQEDRTLSFKSQLQSVLLGGVPQLSPCWSFVYLLPSPNPHGPSTKGARTGRIHLGHPFAEHRVGGAQEACEEHLVTRSCECALGMLGPSFMQAVPPCSKHLTWHSPRGYLLLILKVISSGKPSITTLDNRTQPSL